jgi:O-antigen/teichoic acid export membrane protein
MVLTEKKKIINNKVVRNFSYVTIGNVIAQIINLLAVIKISKIFSPDSYGLYTFLTVQGLLVFTLADLGIRNIVIRTIARDKMNTKDVVVNGILIRLCSVTFFSILYFFYNNFLGHLSISNVLLVCAFSYFNCITNLFESAFWGHQKMLAPAVINILTSVLWYVIILVIPPGYITIGYLFLIYIGITVLTGISYYFILEFNHLIVGVKQPFLVSSDRLLRQSWPYFVLVLLTLPYTYLTNNFLDINSNQTEIGFSNLAGKLMSPISLVITYSLSALFPNLSNLWVTNEEKFKKMLINGIRVFIICALFMCFVYTMFADTFIRLIFSSKYIQVIKISQIQVWYVFLMGVNSLIGTIWGATNNEKLLVKSSIVNIFISGPILYWSSKYGALGLSYGYVLSFAIFEVYLWNSFKKSINIEIKYDKIIWAIALGLTIVSFYFMGRVSLAIKICIVFGVLLSAVIYFLKYRKKIPNDQ